MKTTWIAVALACAALLSSCAETECTTIVIGEEAITRRDGKLYFVDRFGGEHQFYMDFLDPAMNESPLRIGPVSKEE